MKLRDFWNLYTSLNLPDIQSLIGRYRGSFIGPSWLRVTARPGLVISGLRGWWGKQFVGDGNASNLVRKNGGLEMVLPMKLIIEDSMVDGKQDWLSITTARTPSPGLISWMKSGR